MFWFVVVLFQSCNNDSKSFKDNVLNNSGLSGNVENLLSDKKTPIEYKIDSSDFMVSFNENRLLIKFEKNEIFENQLNKIKRTIMKISSERNLNLLDAILIQPINNELLKDIASIPEIQNELIDKIEGGVVNSMGIVSPNADRSMKLKQITKLFTEYNLQPYNFYVDKCRLENNLMDTITISMQCATIFFKLRKM